MYQVIIVVHVLLGLGVIGLILMQQGKGADAGAAFGSGGSSGSVFGAQGAASFLSTTTAVLATLFFTTSLTLAVLGGQQSKQKTDLMDSVEIEQKAADVPLATKTATPELVPVVSASDTPAAANENVTPVVNTTDIDSMDKADKNNTTDAVATKPASSENDSADKKKATDKADKKHESDKKKVTDKADKKHVAEKKKTTDKLKKKHESDKDKK